MRSLLAAWFVVAAALLYSCSNAGTYRPTLLKAGSFPSAFGYGLSGNSQVGIGFVLHSTMHAFMWNGTTSSAVDLNPTGFTYSIANDVWGANQIGTAWGSPTGGDQAFLRNGTAASAINLHPPGFAASYGTGIYGTSQVGYGYNSAAGNYHALLWHGTAASAIDLHPGGVDTSQAAGVSGGFQVGHGSGPITGGNRHALLWSGTAASVVDLHPPGFRHSRAFAVSGASQVGDGLLTGVGTHALLWYGTAASFVDLHPTGFTSSSAHGVAGSLQVGSAAGPGAPGKGHAMLLTGTPESALDLHVFLSGLGPTFTQSVAYNIADNGSIVGFATDTVGRSYAVLWMPVPEPRSCALVICGLAAAAAGRLRRRRL
jgi:hypothetical protein